MNLFRILDDISKIGCQLVGSPSAWCSLEPIGMPPRERMLVADTLMALGTMLSEVQRRFALAAAASEGDDKQLQRLRQRPRLFDEQYNE